MVHFSQVKPTVDIQDMGDAYAVTMEVPTDDNTSIKVSLEGDYAVKVDVFGTLYERVRFPTRIDVKNAECTLRSNVLDIFVSKVKVV